MALETMIANLNAARDEYQKTLKTMGKKAQKEIATALAEFIPEGKVLVWSQYTPYFNDGEPCTFRVNDVLLNDVNEDGDYDAYEGDYKLPKDLKAIWNKLPQDMMLTAFGDHVVVVVERSGKITVNEHEHD